jgi:hypothetical protein
MSNPIDGNQAYQNLAYMKFMQTKDYSIQVWLTVLFYFEKHIKDKDLYRKPQSQFFLPRVSRQKIKLDYGKKGIGSPLSADP